MILAVIEDNLILLLSFYILSRFVDSKKTPLLFVILSFLLNLVFFPLWHPESYEATIESINTFLSILLPIIWLNYFTKSTLNSMVIFLVAQIYRILIFLPVIIIYYSLLNNYFKIDVLTNKLFNMTIILYAFVVTFYINRKKPLKKISLKLISLKSNAKIAIASIHVINLVLMSFTLDYAHFKFGNSILYELYFAIPYVLFSLFLFHALKHNHATQNKALFFNGYVEGLFNILSEYKSMYQAHHTQIQQNDLQTSTVPEPSIHYEYFSGLSLLQNKVLSAFLYSQYIEAKKVGVRLSCSIESNLVSCGLSNFQLIDIFSIVTNNAIEAAKLTSPSCVDLIITEALDPITKKPLYLLLVNNTSMPLSPYQIQKMFDKGISSKNESSLSRRGLGLYKLKHILKHNQGQIDVSYNDCTSRLEMKIAFS